MSTERTNEIDAAASEWLIRRDSGTWTEADQERFEQWLNASTLNRVAYLRLELAWEDAARLKALGAGIRADRPPPPGQWNLTPFFDARHADSATTAEAETHSVEQSSLRAEGKAATVPQEGARGSGTGKAFRHRGRPFAMAATLLLAVGMGAYVALVPGGERYTTPIGGIASVPMIDGSKVTLNTDSQIRVSLTDTERRIELKHGEAFFEVAKDPGRPFIVNVGNKRVIAVGTKFSVRRDTDDIQVIVTEGKVRVEDAGETLLTPGSIARAGDAGVLVQRKTLPEAEEQLSWRVGVLMFRDQSLAEAIAEFNRYNVRKIVIEDPAIAALKIEGNFRATNIDAFARLLEQAYPVRVQQQDGNRVLLTAR